MTSQKQATVSTFWGTVERAATQGVSFIVIMVLARLLNKSDFGIVNNAATLTLLGQTLLGESFSEALVQRANLERAHLVSLFWVLLGAGIVACTATFFAAPGLARVFAEPELTAVLRGLSPILLFTALQAVPTAVFRRNFNFRAIAAASTSGTVLGGISGIGMAFAHYGAWSLVGSLLIQNAVITVGIWRQSSFRPEFAFSRRHLAELWSYGRYTFFLRLAAWTANQSPRSIVNFLFGAAAAGEFHLGLRLTEIMYQLLAMPAANVAVPMIAKVRQDVVRLERAILAATQLTAMVTIPAFAGLALVAPFAVPLLFGQKWADSIAIVQIIAVSGVVGTYGILAVSIISGLGRPDINLRLTLITASLSLALLFTHSLGLLAATATFVVRGLVLTPVLPYVVARLAGVPAGPQYRAFIPIFAATSAMAIAIETIIYLVGASLPPLALTVVTVALGGLTYAVALFVFARPVILLGLSVLGDLHPRFRRKTAT